MFIEKFNWSVIELSGMDYDKCWNRENIEKCLNFVDPFHGIVFAVTKSLYASNKSEENRFYINDIACHLLIEAPYTNIDDPKAWNCDTINIRCFIDTRGTEQHLCLVKDTCHSWPMFERSYVFLRKDEILDDPDKFRKLTETKIKDAIHIFCQDIAKWKESCDVYNLTKQIIQ